MVSEGSDNSYHQFLCFKFAFPNSQWVNDQLWVSQFSIIISTLNNYYISSLLQYVCYDQSVCRPWLTVWPSNFKSLFELKSFPFEPRDHIVNILKTCFLGPYFKLWKLVFFPSNSWSVYVVLVLKTWSIINSMDLGFCQYKVFSH